MQQNRHITAILKKILGAMNGIYFEINELHLDYNLDEHTGLKTRF